MNNLIDFEELEKKLQRDHERQCEANLRLAQKLDNESRVFNALRANLSIAADLDRDKPELAAKMRQRQESTHHLRMRVGIEKHHHRPIAPLVAQLNEDCIPAEQIVYLYERYTAIYQEIAAAFHEGGYGEWLASLDPKTESHRLAIELARADGETIARHIQTHAKNSTSTNKLARANFEGLMWLDWAFQAHLKGLPLPDEYVWGANTVHGEQCSEKSTDTELNQPPSVAPICLTKIGDRYVLECLSQDGRKQSTREVTEHQFSALQVLLDVYGEDSEKRISSSDWSARMQGNHDARRIVVGLSKQYPDLAQRFRRSKQNGVRSGYRLQFPTAS